MKHMKPHEALHCTSCEIYDDIFSSIGVEFVNTYKLKELLNRRGQLPEEFSFGDDSLSDIVEKHYGKEADYAIFCNMLEVLAHKIGEPPAWYKQSIDK